MDEPRTAAEPEWTDPNEMPPAMAVRQIRNGLEKGLTLDRITPAGVPIFHTDPTYSSVLAARAEVAEPGEATWTRTTGSTAAATASASPTGTTTTEYGGPMTPDQEARQAFAARVYGAGWDAAKAEAAEWPCRNCSIPLDSCGVDLSAARCCDDCDHPAATAGREPLDALRLVFRDPMDDRPENGDGGNFGRGYRAGWNAARNYVRAALDTPDPGR